MGSQRDGLAAIDRHVNNSITVMLVFNKDCHIVNFFANKMGVTHDSAVFTDCFY